MSCRACPGPKATPQGDVGCLQQSSLGRRFRMRPLAGLVRAKHIGVLVSGKLEAPPEQRRLTILAWEAFRTCSGGARRSLFVRMGAGSRTQLQTRSSEQVPCGVTAVPSLSRSALTQISRSLPSFEQAACEPITSIVPGKSGAKSSSQFHDANAGTLVPRMTPRRPRAAAGRRREVMKRADMLTIRCERIQNQSKRRANFGKSRRKRLKSTSTAHNQRFDAEVPTTAPAR